MDPTPDQMAALATNLSTLASNISQNQDPANTKKLQQQLVLEAKKVIWQCQPPFDAVMDQTVNAFVVGSILALLEIGVFEAIPPSGSATVQAIATTCGADEELIIRLMRQLTCINYFTEVNLHEWAHSRLSIALSDHVGITGKYFFKVAMEEMYPAMHIMPQYIRKFGKKDVHTYTNTPHSYQNNMLGSNFWEVLGSNPSRLDLFNRGLSIFSAIHPVVAMFPFTTLLEPNNSPTRPLAVDIGGGRGLAMLEIRKNCPTLQGELILQDRQVVLDEIAAEDLPGVTKMTHDFFTEQPVHNAQIYLIRRVMHDWLDEDAARILTAIKPAMSSDSRIIISDMALPEHVTPLAAHAVWMDLMMMTIGGKERTCRDWQTLANMAGLKLVKVWQEVEKYGPLCMVEIMLPDATDSSGIDVEVNGADSADVTDGTDAVNGSTGANGDNNTANVNGIDSVNGTVAVDGVNGVNGTNATNIVDAVNSDMQNGTANSDHPINP